jgi:hypothetical protein
MRALFEQDFWKGKGGLWKISGAFQSTNALTTSSKLGSLAGYIGEAMGGPPICHAFTMVGKSFGIPAILFYLASDANKNKRGGGRPKVVITLNKSPTNGEP